MIHRFFGHLVIMLLFAPLPPFVWASASDSIAPLQAIPTSLNDMDHKLIEWIDEQRQAMLDDLKTIVEINSGTRNIEGNNQVIDILEEHLKKLGFSTGNTPGGRIASLTCEGGEVQFADHLIAVRNPAGNSPAILLSGHVDTVFPKQSSFQNLHIEGDILRGPGVSDMKGGLIAMLYALRALEHHNLLSHNRITVLLNTDEEMGSLGSRSLIEEQAAKHDLGLVFEGTLNNLLTRHRKGLGQVRMKVTGRAAHSGSSHKNGVSAILELSHKIVEIEKLTDYDQQTTVNVGMTLGGEARNTVSPCAEAYIDLRFPNQQQGQYLITEIDRIAARQYTHNPFIKQSPTTRVWSRLHRPAKPVHPMSDLIMAQAMGISEALGQPLGTRFSGGGTDGSIMQAVGLPTADSLGLDGSGDHSPREQSRISSLMQRTQLAAILLTRLMSSVPSDN